MTNDLASKLSLCFSDSNTSRSFLRTISFGFTGSLATAESWLWRLDYGTWPSSVRGVMLQGSASGLRLRHHVLQNLNRVPELRLHLRNYLAIILGPWVLVFVPICDYASTRGVRLVYILLHLYSSRHFKILYFAVSRTRTRAWC